MGAETRDNPYPNPREPVPWPRVLKPVKPGPIPAETRTLDVGTGFDGWGSGSAFFTQGLPVTIPTDSLENHELLDKFFTCVPFTTYEDYQPFVARLLDRKLPRLSDVNNLLAPGLPAYIARTSGTSGGQLKYFLKYPDSLYLGPRWDSPDVPGFKRCRFTLIHLNRWKTVVDDNDNIIQDIPITISSSGRIRHSLGIGPMDDEKIIDKKGLRANFLAGYV
jgi:hypothetical protein